MFNLDYLFCHVDDFCQQFEPQWQQKLISHGAVQRVRTKSLCLSEIMTILIAFHQNHYRNFKHFYLNHVQQSWTWAFPKLPIYPSFVKLRKHLQFLDSGTMVYQLIDRIFNTIKSIKTLN
ncbi:hypothetical protein Dongsha4_13655 [Cyanobacterium sp. Dongsha4]|nr:hypothetical protein Dongsha4_13655 [Cyanobacterium sp. Dongsha4]